MSVSVRPQIAFARMIPSIANQTDILILQHARERFHPFNTARILKKALAKSRLVVGYTPDLAAADVPYNVNAGLLYPSDDAVSLHSLGDLERPSQLVVIDGTWHHAKTIFRDVPALHKLPRFKITPDVAWPISHSARAQHREPLDFRSHRRGAARIGTGPGTSTSAPCIRFHGNIAAGPPEPQTGMA